MICVYFTCDLSICSKDLGDYVKCKDKYKNLDKYRAAKRRQQQRHREKYGAGKPPRAWSDEEIRLLMDFDGLDRDLAKKLNRSLGAIYTKRAYTKRAQACSHD